MSDDDDDSSIQQFFLSFIHRKQPPSQTNQLTLLIQDLLEDSDSEQQNELAAEIVLARARSLKRTIEMEKASYAASLVKLCPVCLSQITDPAGKTLCGHEFCYGCLRVWLERNISCPSCRCRVRKIEIMRPKPNSRLTKQKDRQENTSQSLSDQMVKRYRKGWNRCKNRFFEKIAIPEEIESVDDYFCYVCGSFEDEEAMLICERCDTRACHYTCDGLLNIPLADWYCNWCRDILI